MPAELATALVDAVGSIVVGQPRTIRLAALAMLCRGHVLFEDVPGTGKTTLARALSAALGGRFRRIQFTPDLVPADIVGVSIYRADRSAFEFQPGPIFAQIVLADEINRATPRTQSALLEAMQERQVTVDGETYPLPEPFLVVATQNPIELDGTFRLPEAQLDRFLIRLEMGYPDATEEQAMLERFASGPAVPAALSPVCRPEDIIDAQRAIREVRVSPAIRTYIQAIAAATRNHREITLGVSPRGSLALQHAAQGLAAIEGRSFVLPDDVKALAPDVLGHRIVVDATSELRGTGGAEILSRILEATAVPMDPAP